MDAGASSSSTSVFSPERSSSSSYSSAISPKRYDVFISFRGEDTRTGFTSHLHTALCQNSIRTYIDYEIPKGDDVSDTLIQAIKDSSISLVLFSENYASSKWCLDELIHILQHKKDQGQIVIPIFYGVDPSYVRKQIGSYKRAFQKHEQDFIHNPDKVHKWRHALSETANLAGWDSQKSKDESELIQKITNDILGKLDHICPSISRDVEPIGIDEICQHIEFLLQNAPVIGIWGMGGIGKTTLAKAVYKKISSQFESSCFLENVREEIEKYGPNNIRDKLISKLLANEKFHGSTSEVLGSTLRLSRKKVLIVLDDVDSSRQLDDLAGHCDSLGQSSRVIITTRNKHVLTNKANEIYEAKPLTIHKSLKLFCSKAFCNDRPSIGFKHLSRRAVDYAQGIPLALEVLGSFLCSKSEEEWDSALNKLEKIPNEEIQNVLRLSYDGINDEEKDIFLDISCFLKGEQKEEVIRLLDSCGFFARIGIRNLVDKALVSISNGEIQMHDLIQQMGQEIVRQQSIKEPESRSRLWDPKEIYNVLKENKGTNKVEGIMLDASKIKDVPLSSDIFKKMPKLRFLKFYYSSSSNSSSCSTLHLPFGLESLPDTLRYLKWERFPFVSLPSNFCAEKLVELHMPYSNVNTLWNGVENLENLRTINLSGCKQLIELPDLSRASNLESIILSHCESLCHLHPSVLTLETLVTLHLDGCTALTSLQSEIHLKSLQDLRVNGCPNLKEFGLSSQEMTRLDLTDTGIRKLASSFWRSTNLKSLHLSIENLPVNGLCSLRSLEELSLHYCREVNDKTKLHIIFDRLQSIRDLSLDNCGDLVELPDNLKHLSKLQLLSLRQCGALRSVPELPSSIREIDATDSTSLEKVIFAPTTSPLLMTRISYKLFVFKNCMKLDDDSVEAIMEKANSDLKHGDGHVCIPGIKVPRCFKYRARHASITVQLPLPSRLSEFFFCIVLRPLSAESCLPGIMYECHVADGTVSGIISRSRFRRGIQGLNSDHVFIWRDECHSKRILQEYEESRGNYQFTSCDSELTFSFHVYGLLCTTEVMSQDKWCDFDDLIKECGVRPIYPNSIQPTSFGSSDEKEAVLGIQKPYSHQFVFPSPCIGTWKDRTRGLKDIISIPH